MLVTRGLGPAAALPVFGFGPFIFGGPTPPLFAAGSMTLADQPTAVITLEDHANGRLYCSDE